MLLVDPDARPIIGHRGASGEYPENTLLAFDRALEQGADALELDVRLTADGAPVVIHDPTVDRTTGSRGFVAHLTLDQVRALDAGAGERIPTLDEVLDRYPATPLIVEIKDPAAGRVVAEALLHRGAAERVLVGAFEQRALDPFRLPVYHRSASRRETAWFWLATRVGRRPRRSYEAMTVPERHRGLSVVDQRFVTAAREGGIPVHVWTVDDPEDARRLRAMGVVGIITNYPARIRVA
jgi:glycerophosphoryl diester phosphodiesterase